MNPLPQDWLRASNAQLLWVKQQEIDTRILEGLSTEKRAHMKALEREVKESRRANEILKLASAFSPMRSTTADSSPD